MQTIINPLVVSVGPTNEATITPVPMTHHGGGTKKVLAVAAMVAIPIAAPAIASSIAASGVLGAAISGAMATTAGAVISSAIVGAGLGAITAKVTGGSVRAGAIGGAIAGGIGGYGARANFGQAAPQGNVTGMDLASSSTSNIGQAGDPLLRNVAYTSGGLNPQNAVITTGGGTSGLSSGGFVESMKAGLSDVGQKVVSKITSPDAIANAVLQVGGAVASDAIVGTPDNAEEQAAIEEYKAELQALRQKDEAAFNAKMDAAKAHMVQAGYYDPNYFGLQSANRAAIVEGRRLRDFERSAALRTGGLSQGERRRAMLQGGLNIQSAYDRGFGTGINLQNQALTTATNLIPAASTSGVTQAAGLLDLASAKAERDSTAADKQKERIMNFFGGFNTSSGRTDKETEAIEQSAAEFNAQKKKEKKEKEENFNPGLVPQIDQRVTQEGNMVLRNIAASLNPTAFRQGAREDLQARQRAEQDRLDKLKFRELTGGPPKLPEVTALDQGSTGLKLDNFGGQRIEVPPPLEEKKKIAPVDGTQVDQKVDDGTLQQTPNVIVPTPDVTFPAVDPNKIELPKGSGRNNASPERTAEINRRKTIDDNTNAILQQYGIKRKAGKGSRNVTQQQGEAHTFYNSKEFKDFIYQNPNYLDEIKNDPFGFMERYKADKKPQATQEVITETSDRTKKLIDGRITAIDNNDILNSTNSKKLVELANEMGIDPVAALAIFGIESDFGRVNKGSGRGAFGSMQVTNAQFNNLKKWFADPANRAQIEAIYPNNPAMVDKVIGMVSKMQRAKARSNPAGSQGELVAGLAQLIYNKAIGLPKNLWGAGYQANANKVLTNQGPLPIDDGNISNSDYNQAYVSLYNHIAGKLNQTPVASNQVNKTTTTNAGLQGSPPPPPANQTIVANNRGNTTTGQGSLQVIDQSGGVDTGETPPEETVTTTTKEPETPAFYMEEPSRVGFELRNFLEERELIINNTNKNIQVLTQRADYFRRLAQITRDETEYNNLMKQSTDLMVKANTMRDAGALEAKKAENKIMYLQGMQALSDLQKGSVNRAAMVWSEFSGLDIRINPRSDGKYNVTVGGKPYKTMDYSELSDTLRLAFDQGYRASQATLAAEMNLKSFEAQLDIQKKAAEQRGEAYLKRLDAIFENYKEQFKTSNTVKLEKVDGIPYIQRGRQYFMIDYVEKEGPDGKYEELQEIPVQPPLNLNSDAPAEAFKR